MANKSTRSIQILSFAHSEDIRTLSEQMVEL